MNRRKLSNWRATLVSKDRLTANELRALGEIVILESNCVEEGKNSV
jgi:hypothetical protein